MIEKFNEGIVYPRLNEKINEIIDDVNFLGHLTVHLSPSDKKRLEQNHDDPMRTKPCPEPNEEKIYSRFDIATGNVPNISIGSTLNDNKKINVDRETALNNAKVMLHRIAMHLSSGQALTPNDSLYKEINDYLADQCLCQSCNITGDKHD